MIGYYELSKKVGKSVSTLTEWKRQIEQLTDYQFQQEKKVAGKFKGSRRARPHKIVISAVAFSEEEVSLFISLKDKIADKGRKRAICEIFGNNLAEMDEISRLKVVIQEWKSDYADLREDYNQNVKEFNQLLKSKKLADERYSECFKQKEELLQELEELKSRKLGARLFNKK
ncbi:hypothetical protein P620_13670 (plasmid) [Lactococcus lactis subsp. lactis KLDS 4.0325]|nr:hypothetical protein P620_13670 [Lactococcus lactis subsp. lactis KLDS 4.0325]